MVTAATNLNMLQADTEEDSVMEERSVRKGISISSIMLSRPILALEFSCLRMEVQQPVVVSTEKLL